MCLEHENSCAPLIAKTGSHWLCPSFAWRHKERRMRHGKKKTLQINGWREGRGREGKWGRGVHAQRWTTVRTLHAGRGEMEAQFQPGPGSTSAELYRAVASGPWSAPAPGRRSSPWGWPAWSAASPAEWRTRRRRPSPRSFLMPGTEWDANNYCREKNYTIHKSS